MRRTLPILAICCWCSYFAVPLTCARKYLLRAHVDEKVGLACCNLIPVDHLHMGVTGLEPQQLLCTQPLPCQLPGSHAAAAAALLAPVLYCTLRITTVGPLDFPIALLPDARANLPVPLLSPRDRAAAGPLGTDSSCTTSLDAAVLSAAVAAWPLAGAVGLRALPRGAGRGGLPAGQPGRVGDVVATRHAALVLHHAHQRSTAPLRHPPPAQRVSVSMSPYLTAPFWLHNRNMSCLQLPTPVAPDMTSPVFVSPHEWAECWHWQGPLRRNPERSMEDQETGSAWANSRRQLG